MLIHSTLLTSSASGSHAVGFFCRKLHVKTKSNQIHAVYQPIILPKLHLFLSAYEPLLKKYYFMPVELPLTYYNNYYQHLRKNFKQKEI